MPELLDIYRSKDIASYSCIFKDAIVTWKDDGKDGKDNNDKNKGKSRRS